MSDRAIGVDVTSPGALAVMVDGSGAVVKRATATGDAAVSQAVQRCGAKGINAIGIATDAPQRDTFEGARICSPGIAAVTAELWAGAAQGARDAICLWIGGRVVAGVVLDGRPWMGAHGLAGAAAWLALNPVERQDYRKFGSFAAEVSNDGIARRLSWRIQSGDHSAVLDRAGDLGAITAAHVFDGARAGDGVAISVVRETARYIGMAVANLALAVDPEVIILAGDLALAGDLLMEPVNQECARRLPPTILPHFQLRLSPLGADGIAIGAARLASTAS